MLVGVERDLDVCARCGNLHRLCSCGPRPGAHVIDTGFGELVEARLVRDGAILVIEVEQYLRARAAAD